MAARDQGTDRPERGGGRGPDERGRPERGGTAWREPATRRAAPGGRRATTGQGRMGRSQRRAASELERRDGGAWWLRSRTDSLIQRIKRLM